MLAVCIALNTYSTLRILYGSYSHSLLIQVNRQLTDRQPTGIHLLHDACVPLWRIQND